MGLDMFLYRRKIVEKNDEVAYWRKANQIRDWFDRHVGVENCTEKYVSKEILMELVEDCKKVLADHSLAPKLMPSSNGFFFGSTEYDEWYFRGLESTIEQVEKVIKETNWNNEKVLYYEWW